MKYRGKRLEWHKGCFEFCSEKGCSKCVNLLLMRFDGSVSENL